MKGFISSFVLVALFLGNFIFATSNLDSKYIPSIKDPNIVDKNISKRIEVVFYRIGGEKEYIPTVKVNDHIVGSLMPNTYAKTFVCNRDIKIGVAQRGSNLKVTNYSTVPKKNTNIIFIKVIENSDHNFLLTQVNVDSAKSEISKFNLRSNIINRHVPNCELNTTNYTSQKEIVLSTLLSVFFKTDSFDLTDDTKKELDKFIAWVKEYRNIKTIIIKGYADIRESKKYNLILSEKRAKSVKEYMRKGGINIPLVVKGMGETSYFSKNCTYLKGLTLDTCLQKNRRVNLNIITYEGVIDDSISKNHN